jgi:hypothetical protein
LEIALRAISDIFSKEVAASAIIHSVEVIKTVKLSRINHTAFSVIMVLSILKDHARV